MRLRKFFCMVLSLLLVASCLCINSGATEIVYVTGGPNELSKYVNMLSYTDEDSALTGGCSEALGYAGYAFEAKYITKNYPNLSLPVSGPSYTWDV